MSDPNRELFNRVILLLRPMLDDLVFVGGCATGLLITDVAAGGIRPTKDVDAIVNVGSYAQYTELSERLRAVGLVEDSREGAPLCRWRHKELIVDIMPTDEQILGFSNRWYVPAIQSAQTVTVAGNAVRLVTPAYFIATKAEAFQGRGTRDVAMSHDLEDIITIVDGRPELIGEIEHSSVDVRAFIAAQIGQLLGNRTFMDSLSGFLNPDSASQARRPLLERRLRAIAEMTR